jgi:hypothetical protein
MGIIRKIGETPDEGETEDETPVEAGEPELPAETEDAPAEETQENNIQTTEEPDDEKPEEQ